MLDPSVSVTGSRCCVIVSGCKETTSAFGWVVMGSNRVVPLGQHAARFQSDSTLRFRRYPIALRVIGPVQSSTTMEALLRARSSDVAQDRLVAHQRLPGPIGTDQAEHP